MYSESKDFVFRNSCPICGNGNANIIVQTDVNKSEIAKCAVCKLVFRKFHPNKESLARIYEILDYSNPSEDWKLDRINSFVPYIGLFNSFRKLNRIVDVGTGHGFMLDCLGKKGWDCHGVEVCSPAIKYARNELGLNIKEGTLEEVKYEPDSFDAAIFWNVLDEMPDPVSALAEAFRILRPGGMIVARVRNADYHVRMIFLQQYLKLVFPGMHKDMFSVVHLLSFDRRNLKLAFEKSEFTDVQVKNAVLTWTRIRDDKMSPMVRLSRILALYVLSFVTGIVSVLSFGRVLLAPSIIITAKKPDSERLCFTRP